MYAKRYEAVEKTVTIHEYKCDLCGFIITSESYLFPDGWRGKKVYTPSREGRRVHICPSCVSIFGIK